MLSSLLPLVGGGGEPAIQSNLSGGNLRSILLSCWKTCNPVSSLGKKKPAIQSPPLGENLRSKSPPLGKNPRSKSPPLGENLRSCIPPQEKSLAAVHKVRITGENNTAL